MEVAGCGGEGATLAYQRFERQRLQRLGLNEKYSRYYLEKVCRQSTTPRDRPAPATSRLWTTHEPLTARKPGTTKVDYNSVLPFATTGKTTCGYGFKEVTDNRRKDFGIPPADLPRWRNESTSVPDTSRISTDRHQMTAVGD